MTTKELARWIASEAGNDNPSNIALEVWAAAIDNHWNDFACKRTEELAAFQAMSRVFRDHGPLGDDQLRLVMQQMLEVHGSVIQKTAETEDSHSSCRNTPLQDKRTLADLCSEAWIVQDSCNLSGVVHAFARIMSRLRGLYSDRDTDFMNCHPVAVAFADKIAHLTKTQSFKSSELSGLALNWCQAVTGNASLASETAAKFSAYTIAAV